MIKKTQKLNKKEVEKMYKAFKISSVCRIDIADKYPKRFVNSLTDNDMEYIAEKMADAFSEVDIYWVALEYVCDELLKDYQKKHANKK